MVEILSISPRARYNFEITLRRHPLTYIARWKGVEAVWKIVKVPEDCPPPYRKKLNETSSND